MSKCIFCDLEKFKNRLVFKNRGFSVILSNAPIVRGHLLILPNRHLKTFDELTAPELKSLISLIARLRGALKKSFNASGFNYAFNEGSAAGQSVAHLHIHMLPRKIGDKGIHKYEPRKFLYRPGSRKALPEHKLESEAKVLKTNLKFLNFDGRQN